jgi:hypothetical protein
VPFVRQDIDDRFDNAELIVDHEHGAHCYSSRSSRGSKSAALSFAISVLSNRRTTALA